MPNKVSNINNLKAWGHGPLNGSIYINGGDKVEFTVDDLRQNKMLEVRVLTAEKLFQASSHKDYNNLERIIREETEWGYQADNLSTKFWIVVIGIYVVVIVINICKIVKYYVISKKKNDGIVHKRLKYFRDIPREGEATPGEAAYLYYFAKSNMCMRGRESNVIAATILNLALKGYITLRAKGKDVFVRIIKEADGLKRDERAVYGILKSTSKGDREFKIKGINTFARKEYSKYNTYVNRLTNEARESMYRLGLVDKANEKEYRKSEKAELKFVFLRVVVEFILIGFLIGLIPIFKNMYIISFGIGFVAEFMTLALILLPGILSLLIKYITCKNAQPKIAILTQSGTREREKWKALARYLKEYSLIDEKEVPSLEIWEKYLVYATAFGIADKVIEQMQATYPEVFVKEFWQDENIEKYHILSFVADNNSIADRSSISVISDTTARAYRTSLSEMARHSSSGSSGGSGFSGGGGGRRRRRPEWAEDRNSG